ncbi:TRIC cation channel family protein [Reyranella sp.]|uniref:TRIC cation channel family protein n=1 Tax=Reyranella sp. TaxID=1929291 RepID=UPI003D0FF026
MFRAVFLVVLAAVVLTVPTMAREAAKSGGILRAAWVPTATGLIDGAGGSKDGATPLDLQILGEAARRAHLGIVILPMGRAAAEADLAQGRVELLLPAAIAPGTGSVPYRVEREVLLCARRLLTVGHQGAATLEEAYGRGWRIGVVRDAPYRQDIATLTASDRVADRTVSFSNASLGMAAIVDGAVECLVARRLSMLAAVAAAPESESYFARRAVDLGGTELRLRFGGNVAASTVDALNGALTSLSKDGTIARLEERAARPVMLRFATATWWFSLLDVVGTVAFALSGVLIARAERFSLLGAFVLAGLPAVGGGVVRDLLLGREPIGIVGSPQPLFLVIGTVVVAYAVMTLGEKIGRVPTGRLLTLTGFLSPRMVLEVTDAAGLAAFTVIGVAVAVGAGAEPLWLWGPLAAGLGGAGGGILRDLLRSGYESPALRSSFYAEVCVLWGAFLTLAIIHFLRDDQPALVRMTIAVAVIGGFATRMAVVIYGTRSPRF